MSKHNPQNNSMNKTQIKLIVFAIIALLALVILLTFIGFKNIEGHQIGVKESWGQGVHDEPVRPGMHFYFPGFTTKIIPYNINSQKFVMNSKDDGSEFAEGRSGDTYVVQSADGQDMGIALSVRYRLNPEKIVDLHKNVRDQVEERIIRDEVQRAVKDNATIVKAIDAYSGKGLVDLQSAIEKDLMSQDKSLFKNGIIVEKFLIESITLDKKYTDEIKGRQVAIQGTLRAKEETIKAQAEALKAEAEAQADYNRAVVNAERDKQVGILNSQKLKEQSILSAQAEAERVKLASEAEAERVRLAANAEKDRNILIAEGEKESGELRAVAILAIGEAEAEAQKLKLSAYAVPGASDFVKIEISKQMAEAYKNIKGYIPESMNVTVLSENFEKGISILAPTDSNK